MSTNWKSEIKGQKKKNDLWKNHYVYRKKISQCMRSQYSMPLKHGRLNVNKKNCDKKTLKMYFQRVLKLLGKFI